jgi:hypothetical protein
MLFRWRDPRGRCSPRYFRMPRLGRSRVNQQVVAPEEQDEVATLRHTTLATARLRFLFVAAKIWSHARRTGVTYTHHYAEKGLFGRLMDRLRGITPQGGSFAPVLAGVLT